MTKHLIIKGEEQTAQYELPRQQKKAGGQSTHPDINEDCMLFPQAAQLLTVIKKF